MAIHFLSNKDNDLGVFLTTKVDRRPAATRSALGVLHYTTLVDKLSQDFLELISLVILPKHVDVLLNVFIRNESIDLTDIDLNRILQEIMCKPLNLLWPSRRKEKGLPLLWNLGNDGADLRFKAHIQHPIGLIEDEELDPGQVSLPHFEQIIQPTRGGNNNLNATLEGGNLRELVGATIAADSSGPARSTKALGLFHDLTGQLTRRSQDEKNGTILCHVAGTLIL
mmetsp:Transcript_13459/g.29230  ORF Transcript_13459/g.29230 Transcript_13459/m.29230 type:complete len:225 (+) Transcript_13459:1007-1681(+)